ncbi:MucR family transcriptional regulator [Methylobacterium sp. 092160098-2]|uniref:MucR family transcriptional regulator n=1 Tax=Methylobacterium sp. 092160098-2 TaxID=3025129 RepID=UPI0023819D20|nr:MucR family transcriptional regulator [Methylobacterium sp. 092160098-2]MDE4915210.1 MucR family transcriptional regulator [Methylobacterium sp. 092160098-2]
MQDLPTNRSETVRSNVVKIVVAYVARNYISPSEMPALIKIVSLAFSDIHSCRYLMPKKIPNSQLPNPTEIHRSIQDDGLTSFINGKNYKTLKRHLKSHGLNPSGYRQRYGLPGDYPMVAASYAKKRSAFAKANGLGRTVSAAKSG